MSTSPTRNGSNGAGPIADCIESLTEDQAVRAVRLFYDYLPADVWKGGRKPSLSRLVKVAGQVCDAAPAEIKPVVESLRDAGVSKPAGDLCKLLLEQFAEDEMFRADLEKALALAVKPHMAIDPLSVGAVVLALAAFSARIRITRAKKGKSEESDIQIEFRAPEVLTALGEALKAVPESILKRFCG